MFCHDLHLAHSRNVNKAYSPTWSVLFSITNMPLTFKCDLSIITMSGILNYIIDFFVRDIVTDIMENSAKLWREDISFIVIVKSSKSFHQFSFIQCVVIYIDHHVNKFIEVDCSIPCQQNIVQILYHSCTL